MDTLTANATRTCRREDSAVESRWRNSAREIGLALLLALSVALMAASSALAQGQSVRIEGTYDIYDWTYSSLQPWTTMTIFNQTDNQFSIKGDGWTGHGTINWLSGSYDWTGSDGKTRHSTFTVRTDGTIDGRVTDKDDPSPKYNWDFIAKRQVKPMASSKSECERIRNTTLPTCEQKGSPAEKYTCKNDTYVRWLSCLDSIPY